MAEPRLSTEYITRLRQSLKRNGEDMQEYRELRFKAMSEYLGYNYSKHAAPDRRPLNLLGLAVDTHVDHCISGVPRARINTTQKDLLAIADDFEIQLNHIAEKMQLDEAIDSIAFDAMFRLGALKMGLRRGNREVKISGEKRNIPELFIDPIDMDDLVFDMSARRPSERWFIANRYRVSRPENWKKGKSRQDTYHEAGDPRMEMLSVGARPDRAEDKERLNLYDIWLPYEGLFVTLEADTDDKPIQVRRWGGPPDGPYDILSFRDVSSNLMPDPPVNRWVDLHLGINLLFNKLVRQAERQKTILGVATGAQEDGKRIKEAEDGEVIYTRDPRSCQEYSFGGIHESNFAFVLGCKQLFSFMAHNLETLAGLGPSAETATQEQMINASASRAPARMRKRTERLAERVMRKLAWYVYHSPQAGPILSKSLPGFPEIQEPVSWFPEDRLGKFSDYKVDIDVSFMHREPPERRFVRLQEVLRGLILPLLPMLQSQGIVLDGEELLDTISELSNIHEIKEFLLSIDPLEGGGRNEQRQSPITQREQIRTSRSGPTPRGADAAMMQRMMGKPGQPAEDARVMQ